MEIFCPQEGGAHVLIQVWIAHSNFLPKNAVWKGVKKRCNFIVEKLHPGGQIEHQE